MLNATPALDPRGNLTRSEIAAAAFLARYAGDSFKNYRCILSGWFTWCHANSLEPLDAHRAHVELWLRHCETDLRNKPSTIACKIKVLSGFYEMAVEDDMLDKTPMRKVRSPQWFPDDARMVGLARTETTALIHAARAGTPVDEALVTALALLGLRISEACRIQVEDYQHHAASHRVLRIVGKGNKAASIPLPVPIIRSFDRCAGDRTTGPLLKRVTNGQAMNQPAAQKILTRLARAAGIQRHVHPHLLRHAYVTSMLDAGVPLRDVQIAARHSDPRTTNGYDRARQNLDRHGNYVLAGYLAGGV